MKSDKITNLLRMGDIVAAIDCLQDHDSILAMQLKAQYNIGKKQFNLGLISNGQWDVIIQEIQEKIHASKI